MKALTLGIFLLTVLSGYAQLQIQKQTNEGFGAVGANWSFDEVAWPIVFDHEFLLERIETKFLRDNRSIQRHGLPVHLLFYDTKPVPFETPLVDRHFDVIDNQFVGSSFASILIVPGRQYWVAFSDVRGLSVNGTGNTASPDVLCPMLVTPNPEDPEENRWTRSIKCEPEDHDRRPLLKFWGRPVLDCTPVDFTSTCVLSYGKGQDKEPDLFSLLDEGDTLHMFGNSWRAIPFEYAISPKSVLIFEFKSDGINEAEINGIGLSQVLESISKERTFKIHGTQNWGIQSFDDNYFGNDFIEFILPIGEFYTGPAKYLFFLNDGDKVKNTSVFYRNVKVCEEP